MKSTFPLMILNISHMANILPNIPTFIMKQKILKRWLVFAKTF